MRNAMRTSALVLTATLAACGGGSQDTVVSPPVPAQPEQPPQPSQPGQPLQASIKVLSSKAALVTGGSALIEISLPAGLVQTNVKITINGSDSSGMFVAKDAQTMVGKVEGLIVGGNTIEVAGVSSGTSLAKLAITNTDIAGPLFAGPHQRPWICETAASGLGVPPASGPCKANSVTEWYYKSTSGAFVPLTKLTPPYPADLAKTTTITGAAVDFIVKVEGGVIDESIYRIAILDDPTNPISKPWSPGGKKPGAGWNGKLFYQYVGGAAPGFRSGRNTASIALQSQDSIRTTDDALSLGFAVATGSRNVFGTGQDDVVSAESTAMIKEHFIKNYGVPEFTIGLGSSGGSMQVQLIAQNYPGLLDAIIPVRTYPDQVSIVSDVLDCNVLTNYFTKIAPAGAWPVSAISKVDGYPVTADNSTTCLGLWQNFANVWQNPKNSQFDAAVPVGLRYDALVNPTGARGDYWSGNVNSFGIDPTTGFARSAYDNVGVQYGLSALNNGDITTTQFLDLNERAGGLTIDGANSSARSVADPQALSAAYRSGRLNSAVNLTLPIIEYRNYVDDQKNIHTRHRTFAKVDRMIKTNGTRDNLAYWMVNGDPAKGPNLLRQSLLSMNEWLENLVADTSARNYATRVIAAKPASVKDACWDASGTKIEEALTLDPAARCNTIYPVSADPRIVAGAPRSGDILKCQLKPVAAADYKVTLAPNELARLNTIFPAGVCDWSKPGIGQAVPEGPWLVFGSTPGSWKALGQ